MEEGTVLIGPAGWSYSDWKGIVYPPDMPRGLHGLTYLSRIFDTVEVNSTFYRPPSWKTCASWVEKVAENTRFKFTVKLWERFTHKRQSWPTPEEIETYSKGIEPLVKEGKLGAILLQFPWSFKRNIENRQWLSRVVDAFAQYPLALEIRHTSWHRAEVFEGLARRRVAFCNIDQPLFGDSLGPTERVTAPVGYVRLHGRNRANWFRKGATRDERYDYLYSGEELRMWIDKVEAMRGEVDELYVITNNHYRGQAVVNALEFQHGLGKRDLEIPASLVAAYPRLGDLGDA